MFKLSYWVWIVIGVSIGVSVVSYGYFQFYAPDTEEARLLETYADQLRQEGSKEPKAAKKREKAIAYVETTAEQLRQVLEKKWAGGEGFIDLSQDPLTLTMTVPAYRDKVQAAVNRQLKKGGVEVVQGPLLPFPTTDPGTLMQTYFNYSQLPFPVVVFDLGTVTVTGTYDQIVANVESWSNMPDYFAVADGLAITGTSPELTATYAVTIVGFIPGAPSAPLEGALVSGGANQGGGGGRGGAGRGFGGAGF